MGRFDASTERMLRAPFRPRPGRSERIGVEIELGVVDPASGLSRPYSGEWGVAALLRAIAARTGGEPVLDGGWLVGVRRPDGSEVGLESGCALEYGSAPFHGIVPLVETVGRHLSELAEIADELDLALLSGSLLPYDGPDDRTWAPKERVPLMLDYFRREFGDRSEGWMAMSRIVSVQVTLDYGDAADRDAKYRTATAVAPIAAALFAHSPIRAGKDTGWASERLRVWSEVDPRRTGFLPGDPDALIDRLLAVPPILRMIDGQARAVPPGRTFGDLLRDGYPDGTRPTDEDWQALLGSVWPHIRLRDTLELRIPDGPPRDAWPSLPAFWTSLLYDPAVGAQAAALVKDAGFGDEEAVLEAARDGLGAWIGGRPARELAGELVGLVREGLEQRIAAGLEPERVLGYLDPLEEIVRTGRTAADRLAARWRERYATDPAAYVADHRYR
ncbi:glutamate--cysteine ligase [Actinocorallia lasiicapitis]